MDQAKILTPYYACFEEDLTLKVGDIVTNIDDAEEKDCIGTHNGKRGYFPSYCLQDLDKLGQHGVDKPIYEMNITCSHIAWGPAELSVSPGDVIDVFGEVGTAWVKGYKNMEAGLFPTYCGAKTEAHLARPEKYRQYGNRREESSQSKEVPKAVPKKYSGRFAEVAKLVHQNSTSGKHIMISYPHDYKELSLKIKERLSGLGYRIWIDKEKMLGDINEAMAEGVEMASVLLMFVSQKYRNSKSCQKEASYAEKRDIPLIPLIVEQGYEPDGWLGLMINQKLYFDFSDERFFDQKFKELLNEIRCRKLQ